MVEPGANPEFLYVIPDTFEIDPEEDSGVRDNLYFDVYIWFSLNTFFVHLLLFSIVIIIIIIIIYCLYFIFH